MTKGPQECPNSRRKPTGEDHEGPARLLEYRPQPCPRADLAPSLGCHLRMVGTRTRHCAGLLRMEQSAPEHGPRLLLGLCSRGQGLSQPRKPSCPAHAAPPSTPPPEVFTRHISHQTSALMRGTRSLVCKHPAVNDPRAGSFAQQTALLRRKKSDFHHQGQIKAFVTRHRHRCPNASSRRRPRAAGTARREPAQPARTPHGTCEEDPSRPHAVCPVHDDNAHVSEVS